MMNNRRRQSEAAGSGWQILSDDEVQRIIRGVLGAAGPGGASQEEMVRACRWAEQARIDGRLLDLLLAGELVMRAPADGDPTFRARKEAAA